MNLNKSIPDLENIKDAISMDMINKDRVTDLEHIKDASIKDAINEGKVRNKETIKNVFVDSDSSFSAGTSASSVMGSLPLALATNKVNDIAMENDVVTVSINDELVLRKISRDLFVASKDQLINGEMRTSIPDWDVLRNKIKKTIFERLKLIFIINAQKELMTITHNNAKRVIVNYSEIGRSFKEDGSMDNCTRVYKVTKHPFLKDKGYELRMEKSIMKELQLSYIEELDKAKLNKGCIARMIVTRKVEMVITVYFSKLTFVFKKN